jgi:hypothetical protein
VTPSRCSPGTTEVGIREFSAEGVPRAKIAFVGHMPEDHDLRCFRERNYYCEELTPEALFKSGVAAQLDAVIWTQDSTKLNSLPRRLSEITPGLLDLDVRLYVRVATTETPSETPRRLIVNALLEGKLPVANLRPGEWQDIPEKQRERENGFLLPCVYVFDTASTWGEVASLVCDRPAGSLPKSKLRFDERELRERFKVSGHEERIHLLRRSFWDCADLRLTSLDGGMSGAPVFKAYASLEAGLVQPGPTGAHPHLYFVKIGPRKKIIDEYDKYCGQIFEYIPFHLGPRLRRDRCNLGSTQGILVGDFVDGSEPLVASARGGRCGHAISNLFEKTLGGWRRQGRVDRKRFLSEYFDKKWLAEDSGDLIEPPNARADLVRALGGDTSIPPLRKIFETFGKTSAFVAPAHGDMHATNVLVRHGDAILIDFEKLEANFPLPYDPASLEAGLLVEGFVDDIKNKRLTPPELLKQIEPLYEQRSLKRCQVTLCRPGDTVEWYYNAVNQIRTLSWSTENEPGQYGLTLALCLLRKGCNTNENLSAEEPNTLRAIAFFFGQKILRELNSAGTGNGAAS